VGKRERRPVPTGVSPLLIDDVDCGPMPIGTVFVIQPVEQSRSDFAQRVSGASAAGGVPNENAPPHQIADVA